MISGARLGLAYKPAATRVVRAPFRVSPNNAAISNQVLIINTKFTLSRDGFWELHLHLL